MITRKTKTKVREALEFAASLDEPVDASWVAGYAAIPITDAQSALDSMTRRGEAINSDGMYRMKQVAP